MADSEEKSKQPEAQQSPAYYIPQRSNEVTTPLAGAELAKARYDELAKYLKSNNATKEATYEFRWKDIAEKDYKESEHLMTAKGTILPDESLKLEGDGWSATIKANGKIEGNMPDKLVKFLSYNKVEYDKTYLDETTHKVDFVKQGFGKGGHAITVNPIYRDEEKERADDILKDL